MANDQSQETHSLSNNKAAMFVFWAYVAIPLIWAVYRTFGNIMALFTG